MITERPRSNLGRAFQVGERAQPVPSGLRQRAKSLGVQGSRPGWCSEDGWDVPAWRAGEGRRGRMLSVDTEFSVGG